MVTFMKIVAGLSYILISSLLGFILFAIVFLAPNITLAVIYVIILFACMGILFNTFFGKRGIVKLIDNLKDSDNPS